MNIDLSGKTALVTGPTKAIGLAAAKALSEGGAAVILNGGGAGQVSDIAGCDAGSFGTCNGWPWSSWQCRPFPSSSRNRRLNFKR